MRLQVPFLGRVLKPELQRIHPKLLAELIDQTLSRKLGVGRAGSAIGRGLGLVHYDVVHIDQHIVYAVGSKNAEASTVDNRTRKGSSFVGKQGLRRRDP